MQFITWTYIIQSPLTSSAVQQFSHLSSARAPQTDMGKASETAKLFVLLSCWTEWMVIFLKLLCLFFRANICVLFFCLARSPEKSRIRESLNLLTNADSSTDTMKSKNIYKKKKKKKLGVMYQVLGVRCQVSHVACDVTSHMSLTPIANVTAPC